jgi:hypothetical protein
MPRIDGRVQHRRRVRPFRDRDPDRELLLRIDRPSRALVQLKRDVRGVVELGNLLLLHRETRGEDEVDKRVDVRFLGEVEGGVRLVRRLGVLEVLDDLAQERERGQETNLFLLLGVDLE